MSESMKIIRIANEDIVDNENFNDDLTYYIYLNPYLHHIPESFYNLGKRTGDIFKHFLPSGRYVTVVNFEVIEFCASEGIPIKKIPGFFRDDYIKKIGEIEYEY